MTQHKESAAERIARMRREKQESGMDNPADLVSQHTHTTDGSPDFTEIAKKLEEMKAAEPGDDGKNAGHQKMTIYVRDDIAAAFNALITKRGQQKEYVNQALSDFVQKKIKELGL